MCIILGGHPDAPTFICPIHSYGPWGFRHPHMSPILLSASVCSERHLHVVGCRGPLTCWIPPLHVEHLPQYGGSLPICLTPHSLVGFPVQKSACFRGYLHVIWGIFPSYCGLGGISPYVGGLGASTSVSSLVSGSISIGCPLCFIL